MKSLRLFMVLTMITGVIYPLFIYGVGKYFYADKAEGSLILANGEIAGSSLIAEQFKEPKYFWPRPSAVDYNPLSSGGSNSGPISKNLKVKYDERAKAGQTLDLLFASGSGLDPEIGVKSAKFQVARIAEARNISPEQINALVDKHIIKRQLGFLGEERVNVLILNIELRKLGSSRL